MATTLRPFSVVADHGACITHCTTLAGALRSAKGFSQEFRSLVIRHNGETIRVLREPTI